MTEKRLIAKGVCKSYGENSVLRDLDLEIEPGKIYGLIGRNGVGKTTLLGILTGQNTMDSGEVTYGGAPVWENQAALDDLCFSRELQPTNLGGQNALKVQHYLRSAAIFYPHWDQEYADRLLAEFKLEVKSSGSISSPRARCPWSPSSSPLPAGLPSPFWMSRWRDWTW